MGESYELGWSGGELRTAQRGDLSASFRTSGRRIVEMIVTSKTSAEPAERTSLEYDARGSLTRWTSPREERLYDYEERGLLREIERRPPNLGAPVSREAVALDQQGRPTKAVERGIVFTFTMKDGRLHSYSDTGTEEYPVSYEDAGRIIRFGGTGPAFHGLSYVEGEARGVDLFPSQLWGRWVYGFPARPELFRLDGSCDATLSAQPKIVTMLLEGLRFGPAPPPGG